MSFFRNSREKLPQLKTKFLYSTEEGKRFISDDINTSFENYRFFLVETEIKTFLKGL